MSLVLSYSYDKKTDNGIDFWVVHGKIAKKKTDYYEDEREKFITYEIEPLTSVVVIEERNDLRNPKYMLYIYNGSIWIRIPKYQKGEIAILENGKWKSLK